MRKLFAIFAALSMSFSPVATLAAETGVVLGGTATNVNKGATASQGGLGGVSYVPSQAATPVISKTDALLNNAKKAASQQGAGQQMSMIAAGVMTATAAATCPGCGHRGTCGTCKASLIGAAASALTSLAMSQAKNTSDTQAYDVNPLDVANPANQPKYEESPEYQKVVKDIRNAAKSGNMVLSKDLTKLTDPDGKATSVAGAVTSPSTSGLSASEQASLATTLKKAQDAVAAKIGKDGLASSGSEESVGGSRPAARTSFAEATNVPAAASSRKPSSVEGAFKEYNGEKIGVSVDSMFEMMHRRYKHQAEERQMFMKAE